MKDKKLVIPLISLLLIVVSVFTACTEKKKNTVGLSYVAPYKASIKKQPEQKQEVDKKTQRLLNYEESFRKDKKFYDDGEKFYDLKQYQNAIESYKLFTEEATCYHGFDDEIKEHLEKKFDKLFDENGELKLFYYSIYNTACCYSLLKDYENAKKYLEYAIYAGYPNLNYIFKDSDIEGVFQQDETYKARLKEIFEQGNSIEFLHGKMLCEDYYKKVYGFSGDDVVAGFYDTKWKGKFRFKNYHVLMDFTRYSYLQPDPWSSPTPGAGVEGSYSSYDPYPVLSDIKESYCLNWFSEIIYCGECKSPLFKILDEVFTLKWDDTDYSELRKKRYDEYYSRVRKIERDENEIKASAERRRQKVLEYIEEVGRDDETVFIVPEGTKEISDENFKFPEKTVAILLPEGLEAIKYDHIPDTVRYINLPSTLKILYGWGFRGDSEIRELELPENIEEIDHPLFWYTRDNKNPRKVYVPGWSETAANWDKYWDELCEVHFGEYLED